MPMTMGFTSRIQSLGGGAPPASFPVVETVNSGVRVDTAGTTLTVNLPAGVTDGDLLVCIAQIDDTQATITFPGTWTKEVHTTMDATGGSGTFTVGCKVASGEGASFNITTSGTDEAAYYIYRISGHNGYEIDSAQGTGAAPAPPPITPTWGSAKTLWIICGGADNDAYTAAPANYTTNFIAVSQPDAQVGVSYRTNEAASETPGTFTIADDDWVCATIAVRPA